MQIPVRWLLPLSFTILLAQGVPAMGAEDQGRGRVQVILSSQDGSNALASARPLRPGPRQETHTPVITLDLSRKGQSILGFGGSLDHATCGQWDRRHPRGLDRSKGTLGVGFR